MKKIVLVGAVALLMSGCAVQSFNIKGGAGATATSEEMQPFFVDGIGQKKNVDAATLCGGADKVAKVEVEQTFFDVFLGAITGSIYTPRHARVYCTK